MASRYVVSVMAADRVGIVADVTGVIRNQGGNLGEISQTVVAGYFTMILTVTFPDCPSPEPVRQALLAVNPESPFEVGIRPMSDQTAPAPRGVEEAEDRHYVLTAVGPDRVGLVAEVTEYLRQKSINIEDLATRADSGQYTMILLLDIPPEINPARLKRGLKVAVEEQGIRVELQHHGIFRATNEV